MSEIVDEFAAEREYVKDEPMPARKRHRMDIYDVKHAVRMAVNVGIGGALIWGAVLGDVWLWRLLYG